MTTYETLLVETRGAVGLIRLNRPEALNALNSTLVKELEQALNAFEADEAIGAVVLTGSEKAFAAGADIKEMQSRDFMDVYLNDFITRHWTRVSTTRKPVIAEAERCGLVSRVVPVDKLLDEALKAAADIAALSRPVVMMAKECVNRAFETTLAEGILFERRVFHSTFATEDQKEGMAAFAGKRKPEFKHR
jgi:enoyl-CoA hydratase/carnithine racemase